MKTCLMMIIISILNLFKTNNSQASDLQGIKVSGNLIVNSKGQPVKIAGVNKSGTEFACIQGNGFYDGTDLLGITKIIVSWKANAVRVPLNEQCWLNINVNPQYGGANYIKAIDDFVKILLSNNLVVILDLHWTSSIGKADHQEPMPNKKNSITFWQQVAKKYGSNSQIIFDLFNEPFPDNNQDTTIAWTCIKTGTCPGINYEVAGMQSLVDAVRNAGAKNIIMVSGPQYSNSLTRWLEFVPKDPLNNLVASWHSYNFNLCNNQACWDKYIAPVLAKYPIIVGEIGENDCASNYITPLMVWLDKKGSHYLAWTFNSWDCSSGPALVNAQYQPTNYGIGYKNHLMNETAVCVPSKTLSVTFPSSNEWWLQTSFAQNMGQMSGVQILYGCNTLPISQSSWSTFDFASSTNGVQIPTGAQVILKATILQIEYSASIKWLQASAILVCKTKAICNPSSMNTKISYPGDSILKASFSKNLGQINSVQLQNGGEIHELSQKFLSDSKFELTFKSGIPTDSGMLLKVLINGIEYKGSFNWKDSSVNLYC